MLKRKKWIYIFRKEVLSMVLMFHLSEKKKAEKRLLKVIAQSIPEREVEVCHTVQALAERLRKPVFDISVVVLFVTTCDELADILKFRDFFWDLRTIVILPDSDPDTMTKAHLLRPRYIAWEDDDFSGVGIILKKLTDLHDRTIPNEKNKMTINENGG